MNRYKFLEAQFPIVKTYLKNNKLTKNLPKWAVKFKEQLTIKKGKIMYMDKEIVPREKVQDYLRDKLYSKEATLSFGRDSAHYTLLKSTVGISRRVLMEFLRSQKNLAESRPSLAKAKVKSGIKRKKLTLGTDLIFVRRSDLISHNKKFENEDLKRETYILTTVEVCSGLTRLSYLQTKDETNAELERHIKWFAKKFKVSPSSLALSSDKGSEYNMKRLKKLCPDYKFVASESTCERRNRYAQACFYRILKNRQATTIKDALQKTENMINNTLARKHKKNTSRNGGRE